MWLVLIIYVGLWFVFVSLATAGYISENIAFWLEIGVSVLFAYEANFLRKWTLRRGNYETIGVSLGRNLADAEVNFFSQFIGGSSRNNAAMQPIYADEPITSTADMIVNPISAAQTTQHQKSHWKVGGKRQSDSVVGMFSDD